ncbi:MAG: hypothetical protein PHU85_10770 [Phycisphaerae bacterium]|nr:hypothetical protein [Phycisphaerae bacterium]
MGSLIDKLYQYHQLTHRLYLLNQQIDTQRRRARLQEKKLGDHTRQIDELRDKIQKAQASAHEAEVDMKAREATLEKLRAQLNTTRTNKEYSALLREINTFKADGSRVEEAALQKMAAVDELKKQLVTLQQQADVERKRLDELNNQAKAREDELASQMREVEDQHKAAAAALPRELLGQFDRVAVAHEGEAMAPILKPHPKREEYICGGCNMSVTLEQVNALASRDDVQNCHCCGRLLYLGESAQLTR